MQTIKLKKELFKSVKECRKISTTRLGMKQYHLGDAIFVDPENKDNNIKIFIGGMYCCHFNYLAHYEKNLYFAENYSTHKEFEKALIEIYGPIKEDQIMTVINFYIRSN